MNNYGIEKNGASVVFQRSPHKGRATYASWYCR